MALVVQQTSGSTEGTSLTLTFDTATTQGNAVIVSLCGYYGGSVSSITLGSDTDFLKLGTSGGLNCEIWADLSTSDTSTTVVITAGAAGIIGFAWEVDPGPGATIALDKTAGDYSGTAGSSWTSGATATTIPLITEEFVVGIGFIIDSSGAITGPSSGGWTNSTPITDVIGVDGYPLGGVAGYQFVSSPGTFTYAGTAEDSSDWGACVATFGIIDITTQPQWGGYVFDEHPSYTGVAVEFTIPTLAPEASPTGVFSIWVGLGNVQQACLIGSYNSGDPYWSGLTQWWFPPNPNGTTEYWSTTDYPLEPGDSISVSMTLYPDHYVIEMTNVTQGWSYAENRSVVELNIAAAPVWPWPLSSAEVIVENVGIEFSGGVNPDYGSVALANITTIPAASAAPYPVFTIDSGAITAYPGPYADGSYTMYWNNFN